MRILFDDHIFSIQRHGGVSRCFAEVIAGLQTHPGVEVLLPFRRVINAHLIDQPDLNVCGFLDGRHFPGKRTLLRAHNKRLMRRALRRMSFDVFHPTFYDTGYLDLLEDRPLVVTVHDMAPELMPAAFPHPDMVHPGKRALCEAASAIVAVSQTTKADLVRLYGLDPDRVTVIHHGLSGDAVWAPGQPAGMGLPDRYLLLVGRRDGYKNFAGVAGTLAACLARRPDLHLVCVGGGPLAEEERRPFQEAGCAARLHQHTLAAPDLARAYAHAEAFIYPSLYEGFGLPILESFANGCPAVLSNRSCFPEIAADAALYFDPGTPETLHGALDRLIGDRALRDRLVEAGRRRARDFTWAAAVEKLVALYRRLPVHR
ncbi:glycosyltransferase family 4 protein [Azospirillum thermophilum]|uniref:Glycosyltransferase family 1 protein n=1 Tax=Azospirillum thermophilum TaxID=2202148 RepID=A0A2S2D0J9_9PROT|nr:glycosyltransferase family 1 protein [Azospirillum thermophilum]AWK90284.1 glycosyltransferase family 1 protein [Azospirillum thermophilum]